MRIIDLPEATELAEDDYLVTASDGGGACKILAKEFANKIVPVLLRINAVYTQTEIVYDDTPLDDLKADLVVTAYYQDGGSRVVDDYTLSGTLTVGTSKITVSYKGYTTAFNVVVSFESYEWDLTQSLTDLSGRETVVLEHASLVSGVGVKSDSNSNWGSAIIFPSRDFTFEGKTVEIDFKQLIGINDGDSHALLSVHYLTGDYQTMYGQFYHIADGNFYATRRNQQQSYNVTSNGLNFNNSTFKFIFTSNHMTVTVNDELFYDGGTIMDGYSNLQICSHWGSFTITGIRIYGNQ